MENLQKLKEISLEKDEKCGYGFSIIGGRGSELPPIIFDVIHNSPADKCVDLQVGDVIVAVDGVRVDELTTRQVVHYLKYARSPLSLLLRNDVAVRSRAQKYLHATSDDTDNLRGAISHEDLIGVRRLIIRSASSSSHASDDDCDSVSTPSRGQSPAKCAAVTLASKKRLDMKSRQSSNHTEKVTNITNGVVPSLYNGARDTRNGTSELSNKPSTCAADNSVATSIYASKSNAGFLAEHVETPTAPTVANQKNDSTISSKYSAVVSSQPIGSFQSADQRILSEEVSNQPKSTQSFLSSIDCVSVQRSQVSPVHISAPVTPSHVSAMPFASPVITRADADSTIAVDLSSTSQSEQFSVCTFHSQPPSDRSQLEKDSTVSGDLLHSNAGDLLTSDVGQAQVNASVTPHTRHSIISQSTPTLSRRQSTNDNYDALESGSDEVLYCSDMHTTVSVATPVNTTSSKDNVDTESDYTNSTSEGNKMKVIDTNGDSGEESVQHVEDVTQALDKLTLLVDSLKCAGDVVAMAPPSKEVDRPSAARLAKRLFNQDGFKRSDIARHLSKTNEFAQFVGEEFVKFFDFSDDTLDVALRKFLDKITLAGETQERERVLAHFSRRYTEANPGIFSSADACHTLICAMLLLNSDLHGQTVSRKMTLNEFIYNLTDLNDGKNFDPAFLRHIFNAIKNSPLECKYDDDRADSSEAATVTKPPDTVVLSTLNPFLEIPDPSKATEYKQGYVMRKCCLEPSSKKTPFGRRGWKMFYATLRDLVLYLHKDEGGVKDSQPAALHNMTNAIRVHHSLAMKATEYKKKQYVFRLRTADGAEYLFQTGNNKECQEWIDSINFVAATLSSPPLPCGVGSQKTFQRPLLPSSHTKLNMLDQLQQNEQQVTLLETELAELRRCPPDKGAQLCVTQDLSDREEYLTFELRRYKTYCFLLQAKMSAFKELSEPSLVETVIGEVDEPPSSPELSPSRPLPDLVSSRSLPFKATAGDGERCRSPTRKSDLDGS